VAAVATYSQGALQWTAAHQPPSGRSGRHRSIALLLGNFVGTLKPYAWAATATTL
jgi:hypothetical protein